MNLANQYLENIMDFTKEGIPIYGTEVKNLSFSFIEGLCAAEADDIYRSRDSDWYLNNVIQSMIKRGEIDDGSKTTYDDRKFRIDKLSINNKVLEISLGITHFKHYLQDYEMGVERMKELELLGKENFNDKYAFFSRCPGIAGLVISNEGSVFLGERTNGVYNGFLNSVAGHLDYCENLKDISLDESLNQELGEFGLNHTDVISKRFVGLFRLNGYSSDFTYILKVEKDDDYFLSGEWKNNATEKEHGNLFRLSSLEDVQRLLRLGKISNSKKKYNLIASTRGALEQINKKDLERYYL